MDPNARNAAANGALNVAGNGLNNNAAANDLNYINDLMLRNEDTGVDYLDYMDGLSPLNFNHRLDHCDAGNGLNNNAAANDLKYISDLMLSDEVSGVDYFDYTDGLSPRNFNHRLDHCDAGFYHVDDSTAPNATALGQVYQSNQLVREKEQEDDEDALNNGAIGGALANNHLNNEQEEQEDDEDEDEDDLNNEQEEQEDDEDEDEELLLPQPGRVKKPTLKLLEGFETSLSSSEDGEHYEEEDDEEWTP